MLRKLLSLTLVAVATISFTACGKEKTDANVLKIGASNVPHAEILEKAKPILEKEGIKLEIITFQDYVLPNKALKDKEIDANYFQHIPYLNQQIKDNGYKFVNAGGVHIEPIGIYSKKYKDIKDVPDGATVILSNSVADHGRILSLLETNGLLKLKDGVDKVAATLEDIVENPKNLKFKADIDAGLLPQAYANNEGDLVAINTNYAIDAKLNPLEDALILEGSTSPYVNIIAVREGDEKDLKIVKLLEVLHSKEIQDFIISEYKGAVVPVK